MDQNRIIYLYDRIKQKTASREEQQEFDALLLNENEELALKTYWDQQWRIVLTEDKSDINIPHEQQILEEILAHTVVEKTSKLWQRIAVASAIAVAVFGAALFFFSQPDRSKSAETVNANMIMPGKSGATLTLANGQKIVLSDAANGELAKESGVSISKTADGQIIYEIMEADAGTEKINTLSTSNGETYLIRLPDQSEVWLNAASTIKYPVSFSGRKTREVELIGEAYFEIARDEAHPFIVTSKGQKVEVLGTHFNVNAYGDEPRIKTTLLKGSVNVQNLNAKDRKGKYEAIVLRPGEQTLVSNDGIIKQQADIEEAIAWKMGFFKFKDEDIKSIMRKVSRWYNVDVVYEGDIPLKGLEGTVSRYQHISQLLEMLQSTGLVRFSINKNKIVVSK